MNWSVFEDELMTIPHVLGTYNSKAEAHKGLQEAKAIHEKPTMIIAHTIPGKGIPEIENNYFETDYFAWIDFSASHIVNIPENAIIKSFSYEKVRIAWIARYSNNEFVYNHHCLGGGIFTGHKEIMKELIKLHHIEFVKLMEMGYNINDDKLLFMIMEQNPYLFDTYFSDYK